MCQVTLPPRRPEHDGPEGWVFLHAFPLHAAMWRPQLERLPSGWRALAPDLRGFGGTDAPHEDAYTMEEMADDVAALMDKVGLHRAVVVGLSMGGYVAQQLWARHRDRVRALVLACTRARADTPEERERRLELAARVEREGIGPVVDFYLPRFFQTKGRRDDSALVERVRRWMEEAHPAAVARALRGMAQRPDMTAALAELDVPLLVLGGREDALVPPAEVEALAASLPNAELVLLDDAGHLANLEQVDAFTAALERFGQRLAASQPA